MAEEERYDKPVHRPRESYPELTYPAIPSLPSERSYGATEEDSIHLLDYWHVLLAKRWTLLAVFATVVTITAIATFKQTPIYLSSATIQIDRENSNVLSFKDVYQIESATDDTLQTQYQVLGSRSLARRVIEELHLDREKEFSPTEGDSLISYLTPIIEWFSQPDTSSKESDSIRPVVDRYLERLTVAPVRQARLVVISFESEDPQLASRIINAHTRHYIDQNFQFKLDATRDAERFLQAEVSKLKATVENSEDRLQSYSREKQILITEQGQNTATDQLQRLQEEYNKTQAELVQKKSYYDLIEEGQADVLPQLLTNPLIAELSAKLADQEKEEARLRVTYGSEWPARKRILNEIETIQKTIRGEKDRIINTATAEYTAAEKRERIYDAALEAQRRLVETLNQDFIQYNILKREADSNKLIYDSLLQRQKEAAVSASLRASNIRIVDPAEVPNRPVRPRKALNLALGSLMGLVLGVGLAFFQEYLDNSLKSPEDVSRYLNLATLGMIPNYRGLDSEHSYGYGYMSKLKKTREKLATAVPEKHHLELISHATPSSLMAEAYRSVRTSLMLSSPDHAPRVVLVTSAVSSEGKTVTAANMAISLTQTGHKVVLVDADMRKPRVHSIFALGNVPGLSSVLTGSAELKDIIHKSSIPNLFVLPCGITPPNPGELILSDRFKQLVQVLRQYFDYVVIDSPPLINVSDAQILVLISDAVLLVVKSSSTSRHLVKRAADLLMQSRIRNVGVILNELDVQNKSSTYYSPYSGRYYHASNYATTQAKEPPEIS